MYSNAKAGDTALRRVEVRLYSQGWSSINFYAAVPYVIERVTPTRLIIDGRQFMKETGREHGGKGLLIHPDKLDDYYGNELDVMTWGEIEDLKNDFERFDRAFRFVHRHPRITQYCVYRAFKNKSLRQSILLREAQFHEAVKESLEAYHVEIEIGR
ncbi:hypothetical protein [Providencia phage vB_PreS-PatoteraRojo]|nr:hypothetical protein [Providencia phage vB_PreS-PatoteraRojo]